MPKHSQPDFLIQSQRSIIKRVAAGMLLLLAGPSLAHAQSSGEMPLVRLRLYETGVGYFERQGILHAASELPVPATHLDDALNSLVIWDPQGKTRIDGLSFSSIITEDKRRALAGLPAHDEGSLEFDDIVEGMRGARVQLEARGRTFQGRLLAQLPGHSSGLRVCRTTEHTPTDDTARTRDNQRSSLAENDCVGSEEAVLTLVSSKSEILRFPAREITSLRPLDQKEAGRLLMAADSSTGGQRSLQLAGKADGPVTLGYVAESPLWRATYRVLLPEANTKQGLLQAWALIHNDTEEVWRGVTVDLVSGQPDSFLFPFAAPRYQHRRMVTPEQELASVRQLERTSADDRWDRGDGSSESRYGFGVGSGRIGLSGVGYGGGGLGMSGESSLLSIGDIASMDVSEGKAVGALFHYSLAKTVNLAAHHSALLPLLSENIEIHRATLFENSDQGQSILVIKNETEQTLPAGVMSVFQQGTFAGETALPRLNPGETGRVTFGLDLDIQATETKSTSEEASQLFRADKVGEHFMVEQHYIRSTKSEHLLINRSAEDREVHLSFATANNARLKGADSLIALPDEGRVLAVVTVKARSERKVELLREEGLMARKASPTRDELEAWARDPTLPAAQKAKLLKITQALAAVDSAKNRRASLSASIAREQGNLYSMRESLNALRGLDTKKSEVLAGELLAAEHRVAGLRKQLGAVLLRGPQEKLTVAWNALNSP